MSLMKVSNTNNFQNCSKLRHIIITTFIWTMRKHIRDVGQNKNAI